MRNQPFDIVIIGAGIVGLTQALLCAKHLYSIALIEASDPISNISSDQFDPRVFAITRAAQNVFQSIDCWEEMVKRRVSPYRCMKIWDGAGFGSLQFKASDISETNLGHIIEHRVLLEPLWHKAQQCPNIQIFHAQPKALLRTDESIELQLDSGLSLQAHLIIGSDGGHSWLRQKLEIQTDTADYAQSSLVGTVITEKPHEETAWQRFLPDGPLAFLPLCLPNVSSIVFTGCPKKIQQYESMQELEFLEVLGHAFDYRLGKMMQISNRKSFPLKRLLAKKVTSHRAAIIGDAAHIIHPLAGQGLNLGIMDAACLASLLKEMQEKYKLKAHFDAYGREPQLLHHTPTLQALLSRFERMRKAPIYSMMALTDSLQNLFSNHGTFVRSLRNLALNWVDKNAFIKQKLMRAAMGIDHTMSTP